MIAYRVNCPVCSRSKQYDEENSEDTSVYEQKDTEQWCPDCLRDKKDSPEHKLLVAMFGKVEPEVSLW